MKIILTILTSLIVFTSVGQDKSLFDLDREFNINEIKEFELSLESIDKGNTYFKPWFDNDFYDMIPDAKDRPFLFKRTNDNFSPPLTTWYFINSDSTVTGFFYNWSFYNPSFNPNENKELVLKQKDREPEYRKKYESIKKKTEEIFGTDSKTKVVEDSKGQLVLKCIWDNDKFRSVLTLKLSRQIQTLPTGHIVGDESKIILKTFKK